MDEISADPLISTPNPRRAAAKFALVVAIVAGVVVLLLMFVRRRAVDGLVNHLTLGLLVALIVLVNLISCLVIMIMFAAWRWIKRDLRPLEDD
jgi:uncharacterized membrane protein YozB (DUF420 family)